MSGLVDYVKAVAAHYENQEVATADIGVENNTTASTPSQSNLSRPLAYRDMTPSNVISRLPEIPLLRFDGDIHKWPAFRNRFEALIV